MKPKLRLQCKYCNTLLEDAAVLESYQLHFQVEHDQDEVELNLVALCECGLVMEYTKTNQIGNTGAVADQYHCACGEQGWVKRGQ
jgi:hypothetical protein